MSVELIKYAFIAGEISPTLFGRTDLTKYDLGMALTKNWFVDYRGGLATRPGTEFLDYIKADDKEVVMFEFQFSPDLSNTYVVLFGHNYIRFIQDGAYVLTGEQSLTSISTAGSKVTVTKNAHGLLDGDWVKLTEVNGVTDLNGHSFVVANKTANTFDLANPRTGALEQRTGETWTSGGKIFKVYEVASPYGADKLKDLSSYQIRDLLRLTHPEFSIRNLIRNDHDDWVLEEEVIGGAAFSTGAWGLGVAASAAGDMSAVYTVAAVMASGEESTSAIPVRAEGAVNFTITAGSIRVTWNAIPGAEEYIVYRSQVVSSGTKVSAGTQLGFIGRTKSTFFVDSNIIPDFTKAPYENYNPFAVGAIKSVTITSPGTGYSYLAPITITGGGGTGFTGYAVVDEAGTLVNAVILSAGKGYSGALTVTIGGGGSGGAATAVIGEQTGTFPSISSIFQQRQTYAASLTQPLTLWASQIKLYKNFDTSFYVIDKDSYEFEIDAAQVAPLLHMFSLRGGLLVLSQMGIWLLTGGASGAVTPTNALADPQSYTGVSDVRPLQIGSDLLYIEGKGFSVRLLSYNDFSKVYSGEDKSILSNHLFDKDRFITGWAFAENPYKVVMGIRSDGALLMFTTVKEQDVYAWTWAQTRGLYDKILCIPERGTDTAYVIVKRMIEGTVHRYLERFVPREYKNIEDSFAVDCGLAFDPVPEMGGTLAISGESVTPDGEQVTLTTTASFTGKEGWWVRGAGGIYVIRTVLSPTSAVAKVIFSATNIWPEDERKPVIPCAAGEWSLAQPQTVFTGLGHLEGEKVSILGDGNVFPPQTIVNRRVTLPDGVTKVRIGMGFTAVAKTLPPTVQDVPIESRRKRVVGVAVRMYESRGLLAGRTLDNLYPFRERTNEPYGTPIAPINGYRYQILETDWDEDAQTYFVQEDPLPSAILGLIPDLEVGDDTD